MFPRIALIVVGLLLAIIVSVFVRAAFVADQVHCLATCNRGIAQPYQQLLARMRQLADAGRTEELHALIIRADERSSYVSAACRDQSEEVYAAEVRDLIK